MIKRVFVLLTAVTLVIPVGYQLATANEEAAFHATCPMSGGPAKKANSVDYRGKKVYFCCQNCPKGFEADPAAAMAKVMLQWLETGQLTQVGCPLSGKKCNPEATVEIGAGAKVAFCCNGCKGKAAAAEGDDLLAMLFGEKSKGFTLQTVCPVSGKAINIEKKVEHDGQTVYFCCDGCPKAFQADPAKFVGKLPQFAK